MKTFKGLSVLAAIAMLSACGSNSTRDGSVSSSGLSNPTNTTNNPLPTPSNTGGNIYNLPLAPERVASISGVGGPQPTQSFSVSTSATLKVKITALPAPHLTLSGYTGWVFPYGCMQVRVTVNGSTQTTQVLKVADAPQGMASPCANAPSSQILDFGNAMTGAGPVTVTISDAQYDNCRYYYYPLTYGCSLSAMFKNHMASANVAIQTDGTWLNP